MLTRNAAVSSIIILNLQKSIIILVMYEFTVPVFDTLYKMLLC